MNNDTLASQSNVLTQFADNLLSERGISDLPQEVQDQMREDLLERIHNRVNASVVAAMPAEALVEFEKVVERGDAGEIQQFCIDHVTGIDDIVAQELILLKSTYLTA